jgi:Xaa-Pro aminopeptidase
MFDKKIYSQRRDLIKKIVKKGVIFLPGNKEVAFNYPANTFSFRQDSTFLYFFGLDHPDLAGVIDIDNNKDYIFGNDVDMEDIIWMGNLPTIKEQAAQVGIDHTSPFADLEIFLRNVIKENRKIHFLPPYRGENSILISNILNIPISELKTQSSVDLIKAVVELRSIKDEYEINEIEKAIETAYKMHTTAMKLAKPGVVESEISGIIEGIALSCGGPISFPVILSQRVQVLHNHNHGNILESGKLMVTDAGAETSLHYASDITRTIPVSGKFSKRQKEIYELVLKANNEAIKAIKPGIFYKDVHLLAAEIIAAGLKELGLMKGDAKEAVKQGAHALFFPHGLGHMMGLDVHDMENLGENYVGYNDTIKRSDQFGLAYLRLARKLEPGFVLTVEPGIYFIPELIDNWKKENLHSSFINYDKVETYKDFSGVRIEDNILVTKDGCRVLGKPIPKSVQEVEAMMAAK